VQFSQNPQLKSILLSTAGRVLAEASPSDTKWGIGLSEDHPDAKRRKLWRGRNLLGQVLMEVRDEMLSNADSGNETLVQHFIYHYVDSFLCVCIKLLLWKLCPMQALAFFGPVVTLNITAENNRFCR